MERLKHYSKGAKSHWRGGRRTAILWAVGGGVAITTGLAASLFYPGLQEETLGVQEAACWRMERWRSVKDAIPEAEVPWRRDTERRVGLEEAAGMSREILQRVKDETGSPGIVAAVSVDGKLLWTEGLGYADVENRLPCSSDSVHRVASISKSFTMAAVAKLWEEGKLDLDKPIQHYVPEFPTKKCDGEKVVITTRHLVSHLAGIRHYSKAYIKYPESQTKDNDTMTDGVDSKDPSTASNDSKSKSTTKKEKTDVSDCKLQEFRVTKEYKSVFDALEMFKNDPLVHKPGTKYLYTTHGWTLVSAIVEAAADQDYLAYMKGIFKDLGMPHTVPDEAKSLIYNRARGYTRDKKGRLTNTPFVNLSHKWAGGGFLSDMRDLIQFGNAMLYSYQYNDADREAGLPQGYLKPETMKAIWSPVPIAEYTSDKIWTYAMGWVVKDRGELRGFCPEQHQTVFHTGGAVGASSVLLIVNNGREGNKVESHKQAVTVSSNASLRDGEDPADKPNASNLTTSSDSSPSPLPQGIVVAVVVNLENVGLRQVAVDIADVFQKVDC